jgi:hypothetical protein
MIVRPYCLMTFAEIREILNRRAPGEQELLEAIEDVPGDSLYYHTHSYYIRGKYHHDRYPNDFATWAADQVRDRILSERLAALDLHALGDVEALRRELLSMLETHLDTLGFSPRALFGEPFDFVRPHVIPLPAGREVRTRPELREALRTAAPETLFWHFFEDAFRRGERTGSLIAWVAEDLKDSALAKGLAGLNPYRLHLESLRTDLMSVFDRPGEVA